MEHFKQYWKEKCCCCVCHGHVLEAPIISEPTLEEVDLLFKEVEKSMDLIKQKDRHPMKLSMSQEMQKNATLLESWMIKHFRKVTTGVQISKDVLNAIGNMHWICVGLTIVAMGLDITLTMHDNKEQCSHIISELLDLWKEVMKPMLVQKEGKASKYMEESICLLIEGYTWCKTILNSRTYKRCILLKEHKQDLDEWKEKLATFKVNTILKINMDIRDKLSVPYPTTSTTSQTNIVGLKERIKEVIALLNLENKEESKVVVLHGMGGIGKSTLADTVYREISLPRGRSRSHIEIGENPTREHIREMQKQMVENLTGEDLSKEKDISIIKDKLRQVLLDKDRETPLFIYIDNVLERQDLANFLPLESERIMLPKGSRFLVTTRDASVCTKVFGRIPGLKVEIFKVMLMNKMDAKELFCLHAFGKEVEPPLEIVEKDNDAQSLLQTMVSICGNLPIALKLLGRSLYKEDVSFWRKKLDEFNNNSGQLVLPEKGVSQVLELSYNNLSDDNKKAFLLICVCFVGDNYIAAANVVESVVPRASMARLIELGLLEVHFDYGGKEFFIVKMHDLVKNLGQTMAAERKYGPTKMPTCLEDFEEFDERWSTIKWLRIPPLTEDNIIEALPRFLGKCKELEVIVLHTWATRKVEDTPPHLKAIRAKNCPFELHKLKKLSYLGIYEEDVEEFPVAASRSLRILRGYSGGRIPEDAIEVHKNSLCKFSCQGLMEMSPKFCEQMSKLQSLSLQGFGGRSLPQEIGSLTTLEALAIASHTIQELPHSLQKLTRLKFLFLVLSGIMPKEIPYNVLQLGAMRHLKFLYLSLGGPIPLQQLSQLSSLEILSLQAPSLLILETSSNQQQGRRPFLSLTLNNLKYLSFSAPDMLRLEGIQFSCPSLQYATLQGMENLQVLPSDFIIDYANLELTLVACNALEELPSQMHLRSLVLDQCKSLKALPEDITESLQWLVLQGCPNLVNIPQSLDEQKIQSMKLFWCDMEESLLPPHISNLLPNVVISHSGESARKHPYVSELAGAYSVLAGAHISHL